MRFLLRLGERALLASGGEALPLATPRPSAGLLLTAAVHLACGLDSGRYFHEDLTDCALTR